MTRDAALGHAAMLAFSALVAGSFSLGVRAAPHVDPAALTALRFALAALVLGAVALARGDLARPHFRAPWRHALLGALYAAYFVLMFEGLKTASPVSAAAVFTLTPPMAGLAGWLVLRQVTTPAMALAIAVGAAGALWVIFDGSLAALLALDVGRGEAVYFLGCAAHALYIPLVPRLSRGEPLAALSFGVLVAGGVCAALAGRGALLATDWAALPPIVWITLVYVAIFATAITVLLVQFAALRLAASSVMAYTYLIPTWVIVWEVALGAPLPGRWLLPGIALTVLALLSLLRAPASPAGRRRSPPPRRARSRG